MKCKDGARAPPTTRNIPELGISCSIPLTEYYTNLPSTLGTEEILGKPVMMPSGDLYPSIDYWMPH
jgi:hypothetical protein